MNNLIRKTILSSLLMASVLLAYGRGEGDFSWNVKGFVDTYHALRAKSPGDLMSSRTRVRGEIETSFGGSSLFVSLNASHNALLKERSGFELREAYVDHRGKNWGLRLGRQLVIWGAADGVRITDLVSPMDMTEFIAKDYYDISIPVNAISLFYFNEIMKLELVALPSLQPYILPVGENNPWNMLPKDSPLPLVWNEAQSLPEFKFSNMEYGGRLSFNLPGVDFALAGLYTWNKMPVLVYTPSLTEMTVSPRYYRMGFVGGDISKPLGQFVLRGEVAGNFSKKFTYRPEHFMTPHKGFNSINWLVGVDWYAPRDFMLSAQFSSESIFNYESIIAAPQHSSLVTLNISKKLIESTLQLSNFTYFDINHKGWFSRFAADYALNDHIRLFLGYDWFGGDEGIFGTYKNNSEIWLKCKYSF